jgi:hypothetical protein
MVMTDSLNQITLQRNNKPRNYKMPEPQHDWRDLIDREPAGHLEWQNPPGEMVFNGPVERTWIDDDTDLVHIKLVWVAQMPYPGQPGFGKWQKGPADKLEMIFPNFVVPYIIQPSDEKGDRALFAGGCLLYLEDRGMHLKPESVEGLERPAAGDASASSPSSEDPPAGAAG